MVIIYNANNNKYSVHVSMSWWELRSDDSNFHEPRTRFHVLFIHDPNSSREKADYSGRNLKEFPTNKVHLDGVKVMDQIKEDALENELNPNISISRCVFGPQATNSIDIYWPSVDSYASLKHKLSLFLSCRSTSTVVSDGVCVNAHRCQHMDKKIITLSI